ncbi:MAG: hypothetical protein D8M61_18125 [Ignavibacteriae bacterium]|nr:hypothetical protein [Ignavibacteriota bacterium]
MENPGGLSLKKVIEAALILVFTSIQISSSQGATSEKEIVAVRAFENIKIDGILSENIWKRAGFSELLQQDPDQGEKPTQHSKIWFAYDDEAIYFAGKFYDSNPDSIMARLVRRDFVWGDPSDGCVLYLDSYRDKRSGYFFYVSAAGTIADGVLENDSKFTDLSWDAVWEGVPKIDSDGWSVEMRIPYSQLRFREGEEQVWGINVERFFSRRNETDMIAYTPRNESGFASRFPALVGIKGISPSSKLEIMPYVTGKAEYIGADPNDPFNSGKEYLPGAGVDIKAGIGNSLIVDATVNPDFGQVEVDPAIVNLSDVEYTFEEKRPFFTEGVSIFRFGRGGANNNPRFDWSRANIFYSRRIGRNPQGSLPTYEYADVPSGTHILGAGKITGRVLNDWKIGMIHAVTKKEHAEIFNEGTRSKVELEPLTYYGVFRAQRDFNSAAQGIGILSTFTNRFFDDDNLRGSINKDAVVGAVDGWTFLDSDRTYVITGWAGVSRVSGTAERMTDLQTSSRHYFQRPDATHISVDSSATSLSGFGGRLMINKNRGRWTFNSAVGMTSPKFEINDLGFGSYSDKINWHFFTSYRWPDPTDFYRNAGVNAATYMSYDFGGNKTAQGFWFGSFINFQDFSGVNINLTYNPETYNSRRTRGGPLTLNPVSRSFRINTYTDNREWWVLRAGGDLTKSDDINSYSLYTNIEFKVTPTLTMSVGPHFSRDLSNAQYIGVYSDESAVQTFGSRYLFAHLDQRTFSADIRADWIISPKLSFQVYLQPLIASGRYNSFKSLRKPRTYDFLTYGTDGSTLTKEVADDGEINYLLDADGDGAAVEESISDPDFNYISLRGNAVLRWEYMPGSALYLVWTQSREDVDSHGDFYFGKSMRNLFSVKPDNIFMIKLTYWFGV